jgi:hypothetical protein
MNRYLFCMTEAPLPAEAEAEPSDADRREHEAQRLDVAPANPGDDPPTCGDEGGGSPFPERSAEKTPPSRQPSWFRRMMFHPRLQRFVFHRSPNSR